MARRVGLLAGPILAVTIMVLVPIGDDTTPGSPALTSMGRSVLALMGWMAVWWMTEALPLPATALLPLAVLPVASGIASGPSLEFATVAVSYANPYIFLFGGGFLLALAMERWGLHRRIALRVLVMIGSGPRTIVGAFMVLAAVFSMWVSNTATAVMMLPIAVSIIARCPEQSPVPHATSAFGRALLLGIAWGCSIGGVGTLIGTPPNALLASFVADRYGLDHAIGFAEWMTVGLPVVAVMLPLAWLLLTRVVENVPSQMDVLGSDHLRGEFERLGRMSRAEWSVFAVFMVTALAWVTRPLWSSDGSVLNGVTDPGIALVAAIVLFLLPSGSTRHARVLDWGVARNLPWGVLLLFGGGIALAGAIVATGVDRWFGSYAGHLDGLPVVLIVLVIVAAVVFLTEITSNTATVAAALPVLAALAEPLGIPPLLLLAPTAMAASCAFMMPVATPPNAIVFGSGRLAIADMVRAGFVMNLVSVAVVTAAAYGLVGALLVR